ncbi:SAM-dependent methyltransferase [Mariniphaga sediminis]|jgi:2-polyprenyl-3-methyl-5-hydroxy-6-metoxy-1,4-benzoquinol methylase|uniref:SAM-dependent methyltransferase n=1 Tax=Mariniphaga sediminis TaxID=1628158 RepID=A0A399CYU3_9BACT|nr:class I SAM-dependent methyltransferase [Mariniphaga sediminis]RIH64497.1 SAM-dependent methyltransferase [Mariniphaga sediminis]
MNVIQTAERVSLSPSDNFVFQRSLLAYRTATKIIHGNVLEIGTGSGYGIEEIAPKVKELWTLDKHYVSIDYNKYNNTRFIKNKVPPLTNMPDKYFDFVICFQVIEHVEDSEFLLNEIHRVLKGNGKLLISTPNKKMSLTRNPWHITEYTGNEFFQLLSQTFPVIDMKGVRGNKNVMSYYAKNKLSVKKILKIDVLKLNQILPRWILKIPYDLMNRINRFLLLNNNRKLTTSISIHDYFIDEFSEDCYDLFFIAKK